jgi:hypothetical protein
VPEELKHLPAGSQYDSGAHLQWRAGAQGAVLHQYRDRATQTLDQFDEIVGAEGWWHRITRKRLRRCRPAVVLAGAELEILARWRADVTLEDLPSASVNDVSRPELEPALRRLEDRGAGSCVSVG